MIKAFNVLLHAILLTIQTSWNDRVYRTKVWSEYYDTIHLGTYKLFTLQVYYFSTQVMHSKIVRYCIRVAIINYNTIERFYFYIEHISVGTYSLYTIWELI